MQRLETSGENVCEIAFSPDPTRLAVVGSSGALHLWDLAAGKTVHSSAEGEFPGAAGSVTFAPDGRFLPAPSVIGFAVWDATALDQPLANDPDSLPRQLTFHPSGNALLGNEHDIVRRWLPPAWKRADRWCRREPFQWM